MIVSHLEGYLTGRLLVAMPHMQDSRFYKSLIFICGHDENGAMGLVINQHVDNLTVHDLLTQMGLPLEHSAPSFPVYAGGPVEGGRGFVLHTPDYENASTLMIKGRFALTSTVDILSVIGQGEGPRRLILALGYAGWGPGQLDAEIQSNGWLHLDADEDLVFNTRPPQKWHKAIERLGIQEIMLSADFGHA
jgi:putative transcriptional regulator